MRLRLRLLDHNHRSAWSWPHDDSFMARMTRSQQNNGWKDFGYAQKVFHRRVLVELPAKLYGGLRCCKGCGIQNPFFRYGKGVLHSFITTDSQYYPCGCSMARPCPLIILVPGYTLRQTKRQLVKFIPAAVSGRLTKQINHLHPSVLSFYF